MWGRVCRAENYAAVRKLLSGLRQRDNEMAFVD